LRHDVGDHTGCGTIFELNFFSLNAFSDVMMHNVDMLRPTMIGWVICRVMVDWLSCLMVVAEACSKPNSRKSARIQIASLVALDRAWYSACVEDVATEACLHDCQKTGPFPLIENRYPVVERLSSRSPPQSESQHPCKITGVVPPLSPPSVRT